MSDEFPPLWALNRAAKMSGVGCAVELISSSQPVWGDARSALIAHARTLAKYEKPPVDEAELKRRQDAREAAAVSVRHAWTSKAIEDLLGGHDDCNLVAVAYIALCHRDGVTPTPVSEWSDK